MIEIEARPLTAEHKKLLLAHVYASLGLTQAELSRRSGIHRMTIRRAELGKGIELVTAYGILNTINAERARQQMELLGVGDIRWKIRGHEHNTST